MKQVRIYTMDYRLMATHERAEKPGTRRMNLDHLPIEKVPGLLLDREFCREQALAIGPSVVEIVNRLLDDKAVDRLRTVGRLLKLRETFGEERLEAACQRALHFDDPTYKTVKRILKENLDAEPLPGDAEPAPPAKTFVRSVIELVGAALGGVTWN
jgi:hypothetical protein